MVSVDNLSAWLLDLNDVRREILRLDSFPSHRRQKLVAAKQV